MAEVYRHIWTLLTARQRRRLLLLALLMIASGLFDLAGVALILPFLAIVADPSAIEGSTVLSGVQDALGIGSAFGMLVLAGGATFAVVILSSGVRAASTWLTNRFVRSMIVTLSHRRFEGYLGRPYEWMVQRHPAELSKSVLQEISEVVTGTVAPAVRLIANGTLLLFLAAFLLVVEPVGALLVCGATGAGFLAIYAVMGRRLGALGRDRLLANRERHQIVGEALGGLKEMKTMGLERHYLDRYLEPSRRLARAQATVALVGDLPRYALEALAFGGMILFTLWLLWTREGAVAGVLPVLGAFAIAAVKIMPTAQTLFRDVSLMGYGRPALARLAADLGRPMPMTREAPGLPVPDGPEEIALRGVAYRYPGAARDALRGLDLRLPAGARVGIAGATGAGKTTLVDILLRLVPPRAGEVTVGGVPLGALDAAGWRRHVGYVPQTIHLVDDSILANICVGDAAGPDREAALRAADDAGLAPVIAGLPDGIDAVIGDRGTRLSGGQRQRIGIARALYRRPAVLILDEATSALDAATEAAVLSRIGAPGQGRTLVMVTHRLTTLALCDEVHFLEGGRIAASGDIEGLRRRAPGFRAMLEAAE